MRQFLHLALCWAGLAATPFVSAAIRPIDGLRTGIEQDDNIKPNAYIIELQPGSNLDVFNKRNLDVHHSLYEALDKRAVDYELRKEFRSDIFTGVSIILKPDADLPDIASIPGVISVRPVRLFSPPTPVRIDSADAYRYGQTPHIITGVAKLHAEGVLGKGVQVAVIDTGVDYLHPALGGGFGPSFKVKGGYDFVGDSFTGRNDPVPDNDPLDRCNGHGTHVSGIIGANPDNRFNVTGVAPGASIFAYRIFGCAGTTPDEMIIDALLRAYEDGADVMNLSLGGVAGWTLSAGADVAARLVEKGVVMVLSAGNDGAVGSFWAAAPASGKGVISVASTDNTVVYLQAAKVSTGHDDIVYNSAEALPITGSLPIYALSTDITAPSDACATLPDSTPDLSGYVVVIRRGTCTFLQKLANAAAKGAKQVLFYNNGGLFQPISVGNYTASIISEADGAYLVEQFAAGANLKLTFPQTGGAPVDDPAGGLVSAYTTYGPTFDLFLKPSIAAPGGSIMSTFPNNGFAVLSGTSMAAPFIAGAASLLLEVYGNTLETRKDIKRLMQTTAVHIRTTHEETSPLQTLIQQGSGLIHVHNAARYKTAVSPGEILLNDTTSFVGRHLIELKNNEPEKTVTYRFTNLAAGTAMTYDDSMAHDSPLPLVTNAASIQFAQDSVTLSPGQTASVYATFTAPQGLDAKLFPLYSGWITITSTTGEVLSVPYMGVAASMKNMQVIDHTDMFFGVPTPALLDPEGGIQEVPLNYTFVKTMFPILLWRRLAGTALCAVDLVSADIEFEPTYRKRSSDLETWQPLHQYKGRGLYSDVPTLGRLEEKEWLWRHAQTREVNVGFDAFEWSKPNFLNGTKVPRGQYRLMLRALKISGDRKNEDDYESYISPLIGVYYT